MSNLPKNQQNNIEMCLVSIEFDIRSTLLSFVEKYIEYG